MLFTCSILLQNTHAGRHIPTHWYWYSNRYYDTCIVTGEMIFLFSFVWILERLCRTDDVLMINKNDKWENHILQRPSWLVLEMSFWGGRGIEREFLFFTSAGGWLCNYSAACLFSWHVVSCWILLTTGRDHVLLSQTHQSLSLTRKKAFR